MKRFKHIIIAASLSVLAACGGDGAVDSDSLKAAADFEARTASPQAQKAAKRTIVPLHDVVARYASMTERERDSVRREYAEPLALLMAMRGQESVDDPALMRISQSDAVKIFTPDIDSVFADLTPLEAALGKAQAALKAELPELPTPAIYTFVAPLQSPVVMSTDHPNVLLLGLNHFMGENYVGYNGFPDNWKRGKTPAHLPAFVTMTEVTTALPYSPTGDATLLSRLIYEGAVVEAAMRAVAPADLASVMAWTPAELSQGRAAEERVWRALIDRKLLYSTDPGDASALLSGSPSSLLGSDVPEGMGRFIGYRIVRSYLNAHPDTPLSTLLSPQFYSAENTLAQSKYSPAK